MKSPFTWRLGTRRSLVLAALAGGLLVPAIALAGGSSTVAANDSAAEVAAAKAFISKYTTSPTSIGITKPLPKAPPKGKFIVELSCNLAPCLYTQKQTARAAAALGWRVQAVQTTGAPEDIVRQMTYAVSLKPDGIFTTGFTRSAYEIAMKLAIEQKIPVVASAVPDPVKPPYIAVGEQQPLFVRQGQILANWIVADSKATAHVVVFSFPTFPILSAFTSSTAQTLKKACSSCDVKNVVQQVTDIGTNLPGNVVSLIQNDPDIKYIVLPDGSFAAGVSRALADAGLEAKIVGNNPGPTNLEALRKGTEAMWLGYPATWISFGGMDSFARYFTGAKPGHPSLSVPTQILTAKQAAAIKTPYYEVPDTEGKFKRLWKVK